jgi:hypothetical protein
MSNYLTAFLFTVCAPSINLFIYLFYRRAHTSVQSNETRLAKSYVLHCTTRVSKRRMSTSDFWPITLEQRKFMELWLCARR